VILATLIVAALALILTLIVLIVLITRRGGDDVLRRVTQGFETTEKSVRDEISRNRLESSDLQQKHRQELSQAFKEFQDSTLQRFRSAEGTQKDLLDSFSKQLVELTRVNDKKLEDVRGVIETKLAEIQKSNAEKLEDMRKTVDEKLQSTLEKRLGESFTVVSERLEQVHKGLGEMQNLAVGVGDLKRVLTNVKSRGSWGEIQLEALLEDVLTTGQFERNVKVNPESDEIVEFAIRIPGRKESQPEVWLPIDAKFPREDYERLMDAQDRADVTAIDAATKALVASFRREAKNISTRYIVPPATTDFAIMFLPVEGLYAELMRAPGLLEELQREYRVSIAGPSTLAAFLNSLQLGFRTLAIEKRSSEVWQLLGAVKTEFGKFGDLLESTKKKLQAASNSIDTATRRTRTITRKLREVEELPAKQAALILPEGDTAEIESEPEPDLFSEE